MGVGVGVGCGCAASVAGALRDTKHEGAVEGVGRARALARAQQHGAEDEPRGAVRGPHNEPLGSQRARRVQLAAADGTILASMPFQATAGTGTWGTYSTSITFPSGHVGQAMLRVFSISAKDGSRINTVTVPVTLG